MKDLRLLSVTAATAAMLAAACHRADDRRPRDTRSLDTAVASELRQAADTAAFSDAADVAMRDLPDSTLPMPPRRTMISHAPRGGATTTSAKAPDHASPVDAPIPSMRAAPSSDVRPSRPVAPPLVRQPAPAAASVPAPVAPRTPRAVVATDPTPACASPAMADQRRCLMAYLGQSDRGLDRAYQARIAQLRTEAGTPAGAAEPPSVQRLRTAQRAWLVYRDTECRNRNRGQEGPLWAPVRARCLGEFSQQRAAELAR